MIHFKKNKTILKKNKILLALFLSIIFNIIIHSTVSKEVHYVKGSIYFWINDKNLSDEISKGNNNMDFEMARSFFYYNKFIKNDEKLRRIFDYATLKQILASSLIINNICEQDENEIQLKTIINANKNNLILSIGFHDKDKAAICIKNIDYIISFFNYELQNYSKNTDIKFKENVKLEVTKEHLQNFFITFLYMLFITLIFLHSKELFSKLIK